MNSDAVDHASIAQQATEVMTILVIKEDGGAIDATLGNVEWNAGEYKSGATWRAETASDGLTRACPWSSAS